MLKPEQLRIGLEVVNNREFAGVPVGTRGTVIEAPNSWPDVDSVAIQWHRYSDDKLCDWFSFDDLQYLDIKTMIVIYQKFIYRQDLRANPKIVYVFGDNLKGEGFGGQAKEMRGEPNAIGIPTKKLPSMTPDAFFTDNEYDDNKRVIDAAFAKILKHPIVVVPLAGIGTERADLRNKAPMTCDYLFARLSDLGKTRL